MSITVSATTSTPLSEQAQAKTSSSVSAVVGALRAFQFTVAVVLSAAILLVGVGALPTIMGHEALPVISGSMEPALKIGALAVVKPMSVSGLQVGDMVTYRTPTQPDVVVTHRLVAIEEGEEGRIRYRTKGDANVAEDVVMVDAGAVMGKVVYSVPFAGYIVDFARRPAGKMVLLALPALLLAGDSLWFGTRRRRGAHQEADAGEAGSQPRSVDPRLPERPAVREAAQPILASSAEYRALTAANPVASVPAPEAAPPTPYAAVTPYAPPAPPRVHSDGFQLMLENAQEALAAGDRERARHVAEAILAVDPRNEAAWLIKAETVSDLAERLQLLETAAFLNPQSGRIARTLGQLRVRQVSTASPASPPGA